MLVFTWALVIVVASGYAQQVLIGNGTQQKSSTKPRARAMRLLPLLPLFLYLPWQPSSCHARTILAIVLLWTAPSKLLLLCMGSPLDPPPFLASSLSNFAVATFLPLRVSSVTPKSNSIPTRPSISIFVELLLLICILNLYPIFPSMPTPLRYFLYCLHLYLGLHVTLSAIATVCSSLLSVTLFPQFDRPYLSLSLAEFWGRRWNITINAILRATVYEPILGLSQNNAGHVNDGKVVIRPPLRVRAPAMLATFFVSGIMHELIFVYVSRSHATGEMTAFFVIHGVATIVEGWCRGSCMHSKVPKPLSRCCTVAFLCVTVCLFILRPLRRAGVDRLAIEEYHQLQSKIRLLSNKN